MKSEEQRRLYPNLLPIKQVKLGEVFTVNTTNAFGREISSKEDFEKLLSEKIGHPVFGPIEIEGVKAGDALEIKILDIKLNSKAYQCISKSTGILKKEFTTRNYKIHDITDGFVDFNSHKVRVRPSVGFLAMLPDEEMSCGRASKFGGNLDFNQLNVGSSVHLPTAHDGGLLCVGDLHALQGNGEICGMALEAGGEITLQVVKSSIDASYPIIVSNNETIVVGHGFSIEESTKCAVKNAVDYHGNKLSMSKEDVYLYLSANTDILFGNFSGTVKTCGISLKSRTKTNN